MSDDDDPSDKRAEDRSLRSSPGRISDKLFGTIGYGRPPEHSRFKPGQSGNPKGRPRAKQPDLTMAEQPMLDAILKLSQKPVRLREGERIFEASTANAIVQATFAAALKGNARSQGLSIDLIREAERAQANDVKSRNEIWSTYKRVYSEKIAQATAKNLPVPKILPHPDDIIIDPVAGPRFIGPIDETDEAKMRENMAWCDTLIMQDALDQRHERNPAGTSAKQSGSALMMFDILQKSIPPRLRLSDGEVLVRLGRYESWPHRRLLKELYQSWRKLGKQLARGTLFSSREDLVKRLEFFIAFKKAAEAGQIDVEAIARGEVSDETYVMIEQYGLVRGA